MSDVTADQASLPILPESSQFFTPLHSSPAPTPVQVTQVPPAAARSNVLSNRQLNAIPLLLQGQSDAKVAAAVGVCRESICNWRNRHPRFVAELNRQRELLHAATRDQYLHVLHRALHAIERYQDYDENDYEAQAKLALSLLRSAGRRALLPPPLAAPPPTHPEEVLTCLLNQNLTPCPDDSPADDAPPPPPPAPPVPKKSRK